MVQAFFVVMMAFFVVGLVGCSSPENGKQKLMPKLPKKKSIL